MDNLATFEIVAGTASIISVLWLLISFTRRGLSVYNEEKRRSEDEFNTRFSELESSGNSVSSRTDLGFYVLLEIGTMKENVSFYRHYHLVYFVVTVLVLNLSFINGFEDLKKYYYIVAIGTLLLSLAAHFSAMRFEKLLSKFEKRTKNIWNKPIEKRITNKVE